MTITPGARDGRTRLDISSIQEAVQHYYENGLASSTRRCYTIYNFAHNPISHQSPHHSTLLCSFQLISLGLVWHIRTSIKVYFSAIGNWHLSYNQHTSYQEALIPRLEQVLRGI